MALPKLARHVISGINTAVKLIFLGIFFKIVPPRKMVENILSVGHDQFRIDMQERAKGLSDTGLNEVITDLKFHGLGHGMDKFREELEKAGLMSVILEALENEKFLREYEKEQSTS
jgi:orotidine-5'-phosphate decarboxylase